MYGCSDIKLHFTPIKKAQTTAVIRGYSDFLKEFIMETDAALKGLDAVLSQKVMIGRSM